MNYKHVLIVTYGRTGSTLLQGLLNTVDGMLIRGENFNFCHGLYNAYKSVVNTIEKQGGNGQKTTSPFYGSYTFDRQAFLDDCYGLISKQLGVDQLKDITCWGFKEIRYTSSEIKNKEGYDLKGFLDFLNEVLPEVGVIFLGRRHEDVIKSAFWQTRKTQEAINDIVEFERIAQEWMRNNKNSIWIDYSNIVKKDQKLKELYMFIGAEYSSEKVSSVLGVEHSYAGKKENLKIANSATTAVINYEIQSDDFVEHFFIDKDGEAFVDNGSIKRVDGVCVIKNEFAHSLKELKVKVGDKENVVDYRLPSPKMSEMFPNIFGASHSRFSIGPLEIVETFSLVATFENEKVELIKLKIDFGGA